MLIQPAGGVIGFASAQDAEDAGYAPDTRDGTAQMVQNERAAKADALILKQAQAQGVAPGSIRKTGPVLLADGVSTLTIPAGWMRVVSQMSKAGEGAANTQGHVNAVSIDLIAHPATGNVALVLTMNFPNTDVGRELNGSNLQQNLKQFGTMANSTGDVSNRSGGKIGDWLMRARVRRTTWGGLSGIAISPPPGVPSNSGNMIMVGKGNKAYAFQMVGKGKTAPGTAALIKSFRAR